MILNKKSNDLEFIKSNIERINKYMEMALDKKTFFYENKISENGRSFLNKINENIDNLNNFRMYLRELEINISKTNFIKHYLKDLDLIYTVNKKEKELNIIKHIEQIERCCKCKCSSCGNNSICKFKSCLYCLDESIIKNCNKSNLMIKTFKDKRNTTLLNNETLNLENFEFNDVANDEDGNEYLILKNINTKEIKILQLNGNDGFLPVNDETIDRIVELNNISYTICL